MDPKTFFEIKDSVFPVRGLKSTLNFLLKKIDSIEENINLNAIYEIISINLKKHNISSLISIIDEANSSVFIKHYSLPKKIEAMIQKKEFSVNSFKKTSHYNNCIERKKSIYIKKRINSIIKDHKLEKEIPETHNEINSIISPLILRGEIIGIIEILSKDLTRNDIQAVDDFSKRLVSSITNNIFFHEIISSEKKYRTLFTNSSDGLAFFDLEKQRFIEINRSMEKIISFSEQELKKINLSKLLLNHQNNRLLKMVSNIRKNEYGYKLPLKISEIIIDKNGNERFCNIEINQTTDKNILYFNFQDITEKKRIENLLKQSEEKYRRLVDQASDGVILLNTKGLITFANEATSEILSYPINEIINSHFSKFLHPGDFFMVKERFSARIANKIAPTNYEFRIKTKDKKTKHISYIGSIIKQNKKITGIQATIRDISKSVELQKKIKESKRHYENVIDSIQDDIVVIRKNFKIASCNKSFAKSIGMSPEKLKDEYCYNIFPKYKNNILKSHCSKKFCYSVCKNIKIFENGKKQTYYETIKNHNGKNYYYVIKTFPVKEQNETREIVITIRDVSEKYRAEEENKRLTELTKKILDASPVSIIALDKRGIILAANNLARIMMETKEQPLVGRKLTNTKEIKNNSIIQKKYHELLTNGHSFFYDNLSYYDSKSKEKKYLNIIAVPLYEQKGRISGAISMAIDNTEKILAQNKLEKLNEELERKVKKRTEELYNTNRELSKVLKLKSKFISDASHELRTPLTIIQGNLDLAISESLKEKNNIPESYELIKKEIEQMTGILSDLTMLTNADSNSEKINSEKIDLNLLAKAVAQSLMVIADQKNIQLKAHLENKSVIFIGDETKLERLLLNITRNAIKYTEKGSVEIFVKKDKNQLRLIVKDTGIGIPEEDLPYIFERFYRVDKARSRNIGGTGLGLSICKWIAEAHNGSIIVDSKLNEGTTFTTILPLNK